MNFEEYLLNELYRIAQENEITNTIHVAEYRSFKMPDNKKDLLFVIRYITGNYIGGIKTQPVQIFCYSELNDIQSAYLILDAFSKKHAQYQFMDGNDFIKLAFETPVSMRNFIQSETGYRASVYVFGTIIECEDISDIKRIRWKKASNDYKEIDFLSATMSYVAILNTTRYTGQQLSVSMKQDAGLTFSLTLINKDNDFCDKIKEIMYGTTSGNYTFTFEILRTDEQNATEFDFKLESVVLPSTKTSAPTLTLSFRR